MPRFFIDEIVTPEGTAVISGADFHHMKHVLRVRTGDTFELCDAAAVTYTMTVEAIREDELVARADAGRVRETESPLAITVYQGIPKADKMDRLIRQCVELGAARVVPVAMDHCVVKLDRKRARKRAERWQAIAESAAKQCGRNRIPEVSEPVTTETALADIAAADFGFIPYEQSDDVSVKDLLIGKDFTDKTLAFLIGPEGGISADEAARAEALGIPMITLGPRILRTETAAPAVLAMLTLLTEL